MFAGAATLVVIIVFSARLASSTSDNAIKVADARTMRGTAAEILETALNAETSQRGYLLTGEDRYLAPYEAARTSLPGLVANFVKLSENHPARVAAAARVQGLTQAKLAELRQTIDLVKAGNRERALEVVRTDRGKNRMDELRSVLDTLISAEETEVADGLTSLKSDARRLILVNLIGGILIVAFGSAAFWLFIRYNRELQNAQSETQALNEGLEKRVAERTIDLTRANEEIQRFAYIVSHDLRAPLVNIMGFTAELEVGANALQKYFDMETPEPADRAAAEAAVREDLPEAFRFIRSSTAKMDRLINAILKLSREGRRDLLPESIDLKQVFTVASESIHHQLAEGNATVELPSRAPMIRTDRLAIEQIMGNLLDNAVKYLSADRPGRIAVEVNEVKGRIVIGVRDNGRGIAPQDHERIFELFRRAGPQDRQGEGIGLAHVRSLVRRLGGDITVESRLGEGTTFYLNLPKSLRIS
jgi:signal transduction histidine kinase